MLIGDCGVDVEHDLEESNTSIELLVGSEISAEDVGAVATRLVPQAEELLDVVPSWEAGVTGVMQLVVLAQTAQILRERND